MKILSALLLLVCVSFDFASEAEAQEKLKTSYASIGASNAIWNIAKERGFYKKHGLDVEVVYIGSTTVTVAAILGQDVPIAIAGGSGVVNAAIQGADLVSVACFVNTLDFDLVVHPSRPLTASRGNRLRSAASAASPMSRRVSCSKDWILERWMMSTCARSTARRKGSPRLLRGLSLGLSIRQEVFI